MVLWRTDGNYANKSLIIWSTVKVSWEGDVHVMSFRIRGQLRCRQAVHPLRFTSALVGCFSDGIMLCISISNTVR